jgi:Arc/MetJ family transcription regulator
MRTNIEIDDALLMQVMKRTGARTKREAIHESLEAQLRLLQQGDAILGLRGIGWEGDLETMRSGREFDPVG